MWEMLKGLLFDEQKFRRSVATLAIGAAGALSTSGGVDLLNGDITAVTQAEWIRLGVVGLLGAFGGAAAVQPKAPPA